MDIQELSEKIDKYHKENSNKIKEAQYHSLSLVLGGFTLAIASQVIPSLRTTGEITYATIISIIIMILFFIGGIVSLCYSSRFKTK